MYRLPLYDTFIDLESTEKEDNEILCAGRGQRNIERRVPRLPHAAFIIKKRQEEEELATGRRKRGRGRASIFRTRPPGGEDPGRVTQHELLEGQRSTFPLLVFDERCQGSDSYGNQEPEIGHNTTEMPNTGTTSHKDRKLALEKRAKAKHLQRANFAERNRQIFSELTSTVQDKANHKPMKVINLTQANLYRHEKDTEDILRKAESISRWSVIKDYSDDAPIYEKYGVTHEDIWLFKENKFKMPRAVKQKVNRHNELAKKTDKDVHDGLEACGNKLESSNDCKCEGNNGNGNAIEEETSLKLLVKHEQNVNYLKQLYDEDSWSNKKEISDCSAEEFTNGSNSEHSMLEEAGLPDINKVVESNTGDKKCDKIVTNNADDADANCDYDRFEPVTVNENTSSGEANLESIFYETADELSLMSPNVCQDVDAQPGTVGLPCDDKCENPSQLNESHDTSISEDLNETVKQKLTEFDEKKENRFKKNTNENAKSQIKKHVQIESDSCMSNHTADSVSHMNKDPVEIHISNSKDNKRVTNPNKVLQREFSDTENDPIVEKKSSTESASKVLHSKAQSSIHCLDDFDTSIKRKGKSFKTASGDAEPTPNADDIEGFQIVKKKHRKKKSVSPQPKGKMPKVKPDNTIWRLYGTNVIQVDGLPLKCDLSVLRSMVNSFGTVQDYQVKNAQDSCSVRFRLPDGDSCEYAVTCLDGADIFHDENYVLSCYKLMY